MRAKAAWMFGFGGLIVSVIGCTGTVWATAPKGFSGSTIALGRFAEIDVNNLSFFADTASSNSRPGSNLWSSLQKTKGPSDVYVQNNVWAPGGTTGWHTHPGHSLIIVTAGTVTAYDGDDPSCTPREYSVGEGFVDAGGDRVLLVRNEGTVEARTIAIQMVPAGVARRIDAAAPPKCLI